MRLAVIGANGRTGAATVRLAQKRGHRVVAVARRPVATGPGPAVDCVTADVLQPESLHDAVSGCDAIVSTIGIGAQRRATTLYSEGTANLVGAMRTARVDRLAVVSAAPVGPRSDHSFLQRSAVLPLLERFFGATYRDMRTMEADLDRTHDARWVSLRPPRLLDRPARGSYRLGHRPPAHSRSITVGDLAAALLDVLERPELVGHAVYVAN